MSDDWTEADRASLEALAVLFDRDEAPTAARVLRAALAEIARLQARLAAYDKLLKKP